VAYATPLPKALGACVVVSSSVDNSVTEDADRLRRWEEAKRILKNGDGAGALYLLLSLERDGDHAAYLEIAHIYHMSTAGVPQNPSKALEYYKKAIDLADDALACAWLAILYRGELLGEPDYSSALFYLNLINDKPYALSNLLLGKHYLFGQGIDPNLTEARRYLDISESQGNLIAKKLLASIDFEEGQYVLWLKRKLALSGYALMYVLGGIDKSRVEGR
jgi:TPR repeat protein